MSVSDELPTLSEVAQTALFQGGYNTNLVIVGTTLLGLAAGIVGVFVLLRKRSLIADSLSHATLPGIALAYLAAVTLGFEGRSLPVLLAGAASTGVLGILAIQGILRFTRLREDAAQGIVLSVFFGAGIVLLSVVQKQASGNAAGLDRFILGQTAAMSSSDVALMAIIGILAIGAAALFFKEFTVVCFNESFARTDGWPVSAIDLLLMALVVVVTVAGLQSVGLILVVAMLIIPPVTARLWTERLGTLILVAAAIGALSGYSGSVVSSLLPRKPAGAVIVLSAGAVFLLGLLFAPERGAIASGIRRLRMRMRIAVDHVLESAAAGSAGSDSDQRPGPGGLSRTDLSSIASERGWSRGFLWVVCRWIGVSGLASSGGDGAALVVSDSGLARGERVRRNHLLWEQYLISYADIAPSHVDWSVDTVEHVLDADLVNELEDLLNARGIAVRGSPSNTNSQREGVS